MTKILLPLLFYVSGVLNPLGVDHKVVGANDVYESAGIETIIYIGVIEPEAVNTNEMCKPTGVETIIYSDAKTDVPEKKETVRVKSNKVKNQPAVKVSKKKPVKKIQKKKA